MRWKARLLKGVLGQRIVEKKTIPSLHAFDDIYMRRYTKKESLRRLKIEGGEVIHLHAKSSKIVLRYPDFSATSLKNCLS